jgi:outer membrane protein
VALSGLRRRIARLEATRSADPPRRRRDRRPALALAGTLLSLLAARASSAAEEATAPPRLTLAQAAEAALAAHPSIAAARARAAAAGAEAAEAQAQRRPSLFLTANGTQYQEPSLVTPIHGFRLDLFPAFERTLLQGALRLSYTLWDGGGREARIDQLGFQAAAAGEQLDAAGQALLARVAAAYLAVLGHAEVLAAEQARLKALGAERERAATLVEAGRAAVVDLRRAEAAEAAARADRAVRAARLTEAERELARLVGVAPGAARAESLVPCSLAAGPPPEREGLRRQALAQSPSVEEARRRLEAARAALALAESGRQPTFQATAQELAFGSSQGDFVAEWNVGVQMSVPLWTGGATGQRIARARSALEAAEADLRAAELDVEARLDAALARREEAAARQQSLAAAAEAFAEVARIEKLRLDAEAGTQTDYLEAESQLLASRASRVEARYAEVSTRVELARVTGELSPEWLAANLEEEP